MFLIQHKKKSTFITWTYKILQNQALRTSHQSSLSPLHISKSDIPATQKDDPSLLKLISFITDGWNAFVYLCSLPYSRSYLNVTSFVNFVPNLSSSLSFHRTCTAGILTNNLHKFCFFHCTIESSPFQGQY